MSPFGQLHRLVFDRAENSLRQPLRLRPRFAVVGRSRHHAPPRGGLRADFVKQQQRPIFRLEQNRIPSRETIGGKTDAVRDCNRRRPFAVFIPRNVNAHVGIAFRRAAEPGGDEAGFRFRNRRGVARRKRRGLKNEFGFHDGILICHRRATGKNWREKNCGQQEKRFCDLFSFADEMIFAAAKFKNRAAIFKTNRLYAVSLRHLSDLRRRHINRRRRVRGNFNLPVEFISVAMPFADDQTVRRTVRGLDERQIADRARAHDDVLEAGLLPGRA